MIVPAALLNSASLTSRYPSGTTANTSAPPLTVSHPPLRSSAARAAERRGFTGSQAEARGPELGEISRVVEGTGVSCSPG